MINKGILLFFLSLVFIQYCKSQDTNILWSTVNGAASIVVDTRGNIYVSSPKENIIYQLSNFDGHTEVFAGTGTSGHVDGDAFTTAQFNGPQGLAFDQNNYAMYVCDTGNNAIRKIYQGMVSTLPVTVESPVSITIVNAFINYENTPQTPVGFYVVSEDGTVSLIQDGPVNDDCKDAIYLGQPSATAPLIVFATLDKASIDTGFYPCENTQGTLQVEFPQYSIWYTFTGTGNLVNVSACNSETQIYSNLFVYRAANPTVDDSCDSLQCMGWVYSESHQNCYGSILSFCTQPNMTYYVAVSLGYYYNEHSYGQVELAVFDIGPIGCEDCTCDTSKCQSNVCRGFCEDAPACAGDSSCIEGNCFVNAPNDQCDGAIEIVGNSTQSGSTLKDIAPLTPINGEGNCLQIQNHGLWYKTVGTGFLTYLSTCSIDTDIPVIIHLYQEIEGTACTDNLLCVDLGFQVSSYGCPSNNNSELIYCSEEGATYYYFVESTYNLGRFGLVQETSETPCTVGNDYNPPNDYFYSSFFWY